MFTLKINNQDLRFEHSLVSLSEWEGEYETPFFSRTDEDVKTPEEMMAYFECMLVSDYSQHHLVRLMSNEQKIALADYIKKDRTATIVQEIPGKKGPNEHVTSELIYYWMIAFKIPFKPSDEWHLNRLLMLVKVCGVKNAPPTKQSKQKIAQSYREMNEQRRKQFGTKG